MRYLFMSIAAGALLYFPVAPGYAQSLPQASKVLAALQIVDPAEFTAANYKPGTVRHIVLFRYKDSVPAQQRAQAMQQFLALKEGALRNGHPYIRALHAGVQNSHEAFGQGFDQAFIVEFASQGDRNYYVGTPAVTDPAYFDPQHQKFKDAIGPLLADNGVLVFDFSTTQ